MAFTSGGRYVPYSGLDTATAPSTFALSPALASAQAPAPKPTSSTATQAPSSSSNSAFAPSGSIALKVFRPPVSTPPMQSSQFSTTYGGAPVSPNLHIVGAPTESAANYYANFNTLNQSVGGNGAATAQALTSANAANQPTSTVVVNGQSYVVPGRVLGSQQAGFTLNGVPLNYTITGSGVQFYTGNQQIAGVSPSAITKPTVVTAPAYATQQQLDAFARANNLYDSSGNPIKLTAGQVLLVLPQNFPNPSTATLGFSQEQAREYAQAVQQYVKEAQATGQLGYEASQTGAASTSAAVPTWYKIIASSANPNDQALVQQLNALGVNFAYPGIQQQVSVNPASLSSTNPNATNAIQSSQLAGALQALKVPYLPSAIIGYENFLSHYYNPRVQAAEYRLNQEYPSFAPNPNFSNPNMIASPYAITNPTSPNTPLSPLELAMAIPQLLYLGAEEGAMSIPQLPQILYNAAENPGQFAMQYLQQVQQQPIQTLGQLAFFKSLDAVGPRISLTSGQGVDVGALTFKAGDKEFPLGGIYTTPEGITLFAGTPSLSNLLENPQFTASGEPVSLFPATKSFAAKTTEAGESSNLITTALGNAILKKSLQEFQEGAPVEATYALDGLNVAQKLSDGELPKPDQFLIELKGATPTENAALTDVIKKASQDGVVQKVYGSSSFHLQVPEQFRLGADIDVATATAEQATKLAQDIKDTLNKAVGTDKYAVDPAKPTLVVDATGKHIADIHAAGEATYGVTGTGTPLGLKQTEPVQIENVPVQAGAQTLKEKLASALSQRVINPAEALNAPKEWQAYLNDYLNGNVKTTFAPSDWRIKDVVDSYTTAKILNSYNLNPISRLGVEQALERFKAAASQKFGLTDADFAAGKADITSLVSGNPDVALNNNAGFLFQAAGPTAIAAQTINPTLLAPSAYSSVVYDPVTGDAYTLAQTSPSTRINGVPPQAYLSSQNNASTLQSAYENYVRNLYLSELPSSVKASLLSTSPSLATSPSLSASSSLASPSVSSAVSASPSQYLGSSPSPYVSASSYYYPVSSISPSPYSPSSSYYSFAAANPEYAALLGPLLTKQRGRERSVRVLSNPAYSARYLPSITSSLLNLQANNANVNPSAPAFGLGLRPLPSQLSPESRRRIALEEIPKEAFA